jgi:16S rRNA processing protein RimM
MNREWLVRVREVTDRDAADLWRGRQLLVEADRLPPPDEGELYLHTLIGMQVAVEGEGLKGTVRDVYDAPQGYILEVETATGRPLVPLVPELLVQVDEDTRTLVFAPLPGLLD